MRLLLPFTYIIDIEAIDDAMRVAAAQGATLVPLSINAFPDGQMQDCQRRAIIQHMSYVHSCMQMAAQRYHVSLECLEISSQDPLRSIVALAGEYHCDAILLFLRAGRGVMLETSLLRQLMEQSSCSLYFVRLTSEQTSCQRRIGLFRRFRRQKFHHMTVR
jgi:hypothetical protein